MDEWVKSLLFSIILGVLMAFCVPVMANDESEDPDIDYLPPDSFFRDVGMFFSKALRFSPTSHPKSYSDAKRRLYRWVRDEETLYCGCKTHLDARRFDSSSCGYVPKNDNERAKRLEAEHILPASLIAKFRVGETCWINHENCGDARQCCYKNDEQFRIAYTDLVNLYPTIGELNAARNNFVYALLDGEIHKFGDCDFEVDRSNALVEPRDDIRGDIARVYFYMEETYNLIYPDQLNELLTQWDALDPVSSIEISRNERVHDAQGSSNRFVSIVGNDTE